MLKMSEVVAVAAITALSGLFGVIAGVVTSIYAPVLLETRRHEREAAKLREASRSTALNAFAQALAAIPYAAESESVANRRNVRAARASFAETLEYGEHEVQTFSLGLMRAVLAYSSESEPAWAEAYADLGTEMLYSWKRGIAKSLGPIRVTAAPPNGVPFAEPADDWRSAMP